MRTRSTRISIALGLVVLLAAAFATSAQAAISLQNQGASVKSSSSAVLKAKAIGGFANGAAFGFEYGTTTAYGSETDPIFVPPGIYGESSSYSFEALVTGLQPETTYHFRPGAWDSQGNFYYGPDSTFKTPPLPRFKADAYADLSGSNQFLQIETEGGFIECSNVSTTGSLGAPVSEILLTPTFSGCKAFGFPSATVTANGCILEFSAPKEVGGTAPMDILCSGSSIHVKSNNCQMTIPAQGPLNSVTVSNDTAAEPDRVSLAVNVKNQVAYTVVQDGFLCPFTGTGSREGGSIKGNLSIGATDSSKTPIGFRVE